AFSLKGAVGPGLRADQLEAVERWRRVIFAIAGEEMLHLGHGPEPAHGRRVCPVCEPASHAAPGGGLPTGGAASPAPLRRGGVAALRVPGEAGRDGAR